MSSYHPMRYNGAFAQNNPHPNNKFAALRYSLKMTQVEFGKICGITAIDVGRYENGRTPSIPTFLKMIKSAKVHGVDLTIDLFDKES